MRLTHVSTVVKRYSSHGVAGLRGNRYTLCMSKTSVIVDRDIARQAAEILGTTSLRDTIDASLREVVLAQRRLELVDLLSEEGRFDFDASKRAWGGDS